MYHGLGEFNGQPFVYAHRLSSHSSVQVFFLFAGGIFSGKVVPYVSDAARLTSG
jgi:hypothetical protein